MTTATISRKWKAGAELARRIERELNTGRATRPALEVERRLAVCRRCDQFRGDSCAEIELQPDGPTLCDLLCREDLHCRWWSVGFDRRRSPPAVTEAGLDRLHQQGTRRSPEEHRAARRKRD